jgi:hypothetical protein
MVDWLVGLGLIIPLITRTGGIKSKYGMYSTLARTEFSS